ncbi:MAG TPA: LysR family transcriptional regulator [Myxococcota bacterium]|nr:LysR family transcriptional regulator [Myxococcota bacterium]
MDLLHLRYIRTIAQERSLTGAARALSVAQPTLTAAVQRMEAELGTRLLRRHARGVELTATGAELLRHAQTILQLVDRVPGAIAELEQGLRGRFVIGCYESLGAWFLPGFLRRMLDLYPHVELTLWNGSSAAVQDQVLAGAAQFGLVVNATPAPDLVILPACHDVIEIVGVEGTELAAGPLLYVDRQPFVGLIDQLRELDRLPPRLISCGDLELVKSLALAGVGVGVLPRRVADYGHPGALRVLDPELPRFDDTIHLVFRGDLHRTRAAQLVKNELLAWGRALDGLAR